MIRRMQLAPRPHFERLSKSSLLRRAISYGGLCVIAAGHLPDASGQQNLGFETTTETAPAGWQIRSGAIDTSIHTEGGASLRLTSSGSQLPAGVVTAIATQTVSRDAFAGDRIRLAADIKTEGVDRGYAGIWLRIDGPHGFIHIDDMRNEPASGTRDWSRHEIEVAVPPEASRVMFGAHIAGNGTAWFDDLALQSYSSRSLPPPAEDVAAYINAVLDIVEKHSIVADTVSWPPFRESTMSAVRGRETIRDAHAAVAVLLRRLGDNHSGFISPELADRLQSNEPADLGPWTSPAAELLDGRYGYVSIPGFIGSHEQRETRFADEIRAAIRGLDTPGRCAWIVDLRSNTGGNMWPMLAGLGPLLDEADLGSLRRNDGTRQSWWYRDGTSGLGDESRTTASRTTALGTLRGPIAVLVGPLTASSGEAVTLSFVGSADTRIFGSKTAGLTTGNEPFVLSDGAILNLATSVMTDRFGREYSTGIEPDVVVDEPSGDGPIEKQAAVQAAVRWLAQSQACDASR